MSFLIYWNLAKFNWANMKKHLLAVFLAAFSSLAGASQITLIVPYSPGGFVDTTTRIVASHLSKKLNEPVIVENRPGGSGIIGAEYAARSKPDGRVLYIGQSTFQTAVPHLNNKQDWSSVKNMVPISMMAVATNVLVITPSIQVNNLKEFADHVKRNEGKMFFASSSIGSMPHLAAEVFMKESGVKLTHVPYTQSALNAIGDLMNGTVHMMITSPPPIEQHIRSGKLKALAVTSKKRHPLLPDVPTSAEAGLPGFNTLDWVGIFAPQGTPQAIIDKYNEVMKEILSNKEAQDAAIARGIELQYMAPDKFQTLISRDYESWGKILAK